MKRLLILIILLFASVCIAGEPIQLARMNVGIVGGGTSVAEAPSYTAQITNNETPYSTTYGPGYGGVPSVTAVRFQANASYTITKVAFDGFKRAGSPTYDVYCAIYTDSSSQPGTLVGTASSALATNTFPVTESNTIANWPVCTGMSAAITNASYYWVLVYSLTSDYTNYIGIGFQNNGGGTTNPLVSTWPIVTWSADGQGVGGYNLPFKMVIYSTP